MGALAKWQDKRAVRSFSLRVSFNPATPAMKNSPVDPGLMFILITLLSILLFYIAANRSKNVLIVLLAWTGLQGMIGWIGFYTVTDSIPPKTVLLLLPPLLLIIIFFDFCRKTVPG